jgi:predicted  nucleic acid-binding Zn-ribbon protein
MTARMDLMNYELDTTNRQLATLNQKLESTSTQVNALGEKLDSAIQRFESLDKTLNRLPFLGPPQPVKVSPAPEE